MPDSTELLNLIPRCQAKLLAKGIDLGPFIAVGSDGVVYWAEHENSPKIIKFTISPKEAGLARYLKGHSHPHFPKIYQVFEITDLCNSRDPVWLIERENLPNLQSTNFTSGFLSLLIRAIYLTAPNVTLDDSIRQLQLTLAEATKPNSRYKLAASEIRQVRTFFRFIIWCARLGIYLGDLGYTLDNWGLRPTDGLIVVRDFSKCYFKRSQNALRQIQKLI